MGKVRRIGPTTQDLIDALATLQEAVEDLNGHVQELNDTVGNLFNAFDPQCGESLRQLISAAEAICAAVGSAPEGKQTRNRRRPQKSAPKAPSTS